VSGEEIEVFIAHEIGHVLNGDLRLASSIKVFSDLKIIRFVIIATFIALALVYLLLGIVFTLIYNPQKLAYVLHHLTDFKYYLPIFAVSYVLYFLVDLLIRTSFKTREYFADARTLQMCSEDLVIKTLERTSSPYVFLVPNHVPLVPFPTGMLGSRPVKMAKLLCGFLPASKHFQVKAITKVEQLGAKISPIFVTHPSNADRIEAIVSRKYVPSRPVFISYKSYFTVGLIVFLFSLFTIIFLSISSPSYWTLVLQFLCSLTIIVIINNSHLRFLKQDELILLIESFALCGFGMTFLEYKNAGRRLMFATGLGILPFVTANSVVWTIGFFKHHLPIIFCLVSLLIPCVLTYLFTIIFLFILSRLSKRVEPGKVTLYPPGKSAYNQHAPI
jgi:hypothetical protein